MKKFPSGHIEAHPMPNYLKTFISSSAMCSTTRYINPLSFMGENENGNKKEIIIVDTPGFGDS